MARYTFLPSDHAQRDACVRAADKMIAAGNLHPMIATTFAEVYSPAQAEYTTTLRRYRTAVAAIATTQEAVRLASVSFDASWRRWHSTVRAPSGVAIPRQVAALLSGVLPGELPQKAPEEKVNLTRDLLEQLAERPALMGDLARLSELQAAHATLTEAVGADEVATRARTDSSNDLATATAAFDKAWKVVVKNIEGVRPLDMAELLPQFPVRARKRKVAEPEVEPEKSEDAEAPVEEPEPGEGQEPEPSDPEPQPEEPPQAA